MARLAGAFLPRIGEYRIRYFASILIIIKYPAIEMVIGIIKIRGQPRRLIGRARGKIIRLKFTRNTQAS